MACACPCFGDEADAEEKPNQMIQLDGLGMLRLDTQHVGQGSQGARSAKWFYFGETDNRLAVVNMLLCITCFLMLVLVICVAQKGFFNYTSEQSNTGVLQEDGGPQEGTGEIVPASSNDNGQPQASHTHVEADKKRFKKALGDIQKAVDYKGDKLADLPAYVKNIRESKDGAEKQLKEMQVLYQQKTEKLIREKKTLESEKVQLEKHLKIHKDAKNTLGTNNIELTKTVTELRESITNLNDELSSK
eukprot:352268_1